MANTDHTEATATVPTEGTAPTDPAEFAQWAWTQIENCRAAQPKVLKAAFKAAIDADPAAYEEAYGEDVRNGELRRALLPTPMPRNDMVRSRLMLLAGILTEMVEHGDEAQTAFVKRLLGIEDPAAETVDAVEEEAPAVEGKQVTAKMAWTGQTITVTVDIPYGNAARDAHPMNITNPDILIYSPKTGLVESAGRALTMATDLVTMLQDSGALKALSEEEEEAFYEEWDEPWIIAHLTREDWETIFDDANIAVVK